jgi:DNA-binding MarR family transcriptional regulator
MRDVTTMAETIRQTKPFDSPATELVLTLFRVADLVGLRAYEPVRGSGISSAQYNVLRILRGSPNGLQTREVCRRMVTRAPNLTRLVDKLETKGLLARTRSTEDRRVVTLRITSKGLDLLESLDGPVLEATLDAARGLGSEHPATLIHLLNRLRAPLERGKELQES